MDLPATGPNWKAEAKNDQGTARPHLEEDHSPTAKSFPEKDLERAPRAAAAQPRPSLVPDSLCNFMQSISSYHK